MISFLIAFVIAAAALAGVMLVLTAREAIQLRQDRKRRAERAGNRVD